MVSNHNENKDKASVRDKGGLRIEKNIIHYGLRTIKIQCKSIESKQFKQFMSALTTFQIKRIFCCCYYCIGIDIERYKQYNENDCLIIFQTIYRSMCMCVGWKICCLCLSVCFQFHFYTRSTLPLAVGENIYINVSN